VLEKDENVAVGQTKWQLPYLEMAWPMLPYLEMAWPMLPYLEMASLIWNEYTNALKRFLFKLQLSQREYNDVSGTIYSLG